MRNVVRGFALFLFIGVWCRADLTLRYTVDMKPVNVAPLALANPFAIRIKGDKTLTKLGGLTAIIDSSAMTLLNPATKQYAQVSMAVYMDGFRAEVPTASAAAMKNLKFDVETSKTGQVETIAGIRAEDHLTTLTVSANVPGVPESPTLRLEMHTWLASPDDLNGFPALRQYTASAQRAMNVSSSQAALERLFRQMPGVAEKLRAVTEEAARSAGSLTLKIQEAAYNVKAGPSAPIFAMTIQLAGFSSDAIDDSVFEVAPDFQLVDIGELINASTPIRAAPAPMRRDLAPGEEISKIGNGVSPPAVIYKRDPEYTKEARLAKLSGTVALKLVVDKEGAARNIEVVQSLGLGLDEKAIEAVSQWTFRPGQKDGQPVNVLATIQITFRLLDHPPQQ